MNEFRCHWQVHWTSRADAGKGPLRASGYGASPEAAWDDLLGQLRAWQPRWIEEAREHLDAADEVRQALDAA